MLNCQMNRNSIMSRTKERKNKRAFTISEAAEYACVSRGTVINWITSGLLPFEELPSRGDGSHKFRLIRRADIDQFFDEHYIQGDEKNTRVALVYNLMTTKIKRVFEPVGYCLAHGILECLPR